MKKKQDIQFTRGDHHNAEYTIVDQNGTAQSLTGATSVKWEAFSGSTAVIQKSLADGVVLFDVDDTDDGVRVSLDPDDTEDLAIGAYKCELECVLATKRVTLAQGHLILDEELIANPT